MRMGGAFLRGGRKKRKKDEKKAALSGLLDRGL